MTPTLNFASAPNARRANQYDAATPAAPPTNSRLDRSLNCDSDMDCIPHTRKHAAHIGEAPGHAGHRVVGVDLVLQVDEAFVLNGDERFKDGADRHLAVTHGNLALLDVQVGQVLHMHVEEARSDFMDGLDDVRAGTLGVAYIDAAADSRDHVFDELADVE